MAFDLSNSAYGAQAIVVPRTQFRRTERLVVILGATAFGAAAGFAAAMMVGRIDLWVMIVAAVPILAFTLHLTAQTLTEAISRNAYGCATASILHVAALLAWPMTSLFAPMTVGLLWIAPLLALSALVLFASCWGGGSRAVYRSCAQGALVAALAAHQGIVVMLGA